VSEGRVFRRIDRHGNIGLALSDRALAEIVAACAAAAGLEGNFAGHSLRAGFATAAARLVARRPQSCATGAGRACRSPGATSVREPAGTITPRLTSDCNPRQPQGGSVSRDRLPRNDPRGRRLGRGHRVCDRCSRHFIAPGTIVAPPLALVLMGDRRPMRAEG
jgi:hypothetical protein